MVLAAITSHIACRWELLVNLIGLMTRCKLDAWVTPEAAYLPQ